MSAMSRAENRVLIFGALALLWAAFWAGVAVVTL
jgi:hypothetical protein